MFATLDAFYLFLHLKKNTPTRCCYCCSLSDRCLVKNGIQFYKKVKLRKSFFSWNGKQRLDAVNSGFATKTKVQPNANNILHEKKDWIMYTGSVGIRPCITAVHIAQIKRYMLRTFATMRLVRVIYKMEHIALLPCKTLISRRWMHLLFSYTFSTTSEFCVSF